MEGSLLTLIVLIVLAPLQMWNEKSKTFASLCPVEKSLERAANGFAVMMLSAMAAFWLYGAKVFGVFAALLTHPREAAWALVFVVPFIYGLVRFGVGFKNFWSAPIDDVMLALRAFWKMAAGFVGVKWLRWDVERVINQNGFWWGLGLLVLLTVAYWLFLTGAARFVLLTIGGSNALKKLLKYLKEKKEYSGLSV